MDEIKASTEGSEALGYRPVKLTLTPATFASSGQPRIASDRTRPQAVYRHCERKAIIRRSMPT